MKIISTILGRFFVLEAVSTTYGWELLLHEARFSKGKISVVQTLKGIPPGDLPKDRPFALLIHGRGVISRTFGADDGVVAGITGNKEEFLSHIVEQGDGVVITFMRRELYDKLMEELGKYRQSIVSTRICSTREAADEVCRAAEEFYTKDTSWRNLVSGDRCGETINALLFKKLMLPVAGFILAVLVADLCVRAELRERIAGQKMVISAMNRGAAEDDQRRRETEQFYDRVSYTSAYPPAFVADRIASKAILPVILNSITINPVLKKPADDTPADIEPDVVAIKGESTSHAAVTKFAESLRQLAFVNSLQLSYFELNRDDIYVFEITIRL